MLNNNKIDTSNWIEYRVRDIFKVSACKTTRLETLEENPKGKEFISQKSENNGLIYCVNADPTEPAQSISIDGNQKGSAFYHDSEYLTTNNMSKLENRNLNKFNGLFICSILNSKINMGLFNYGYKRIGNRLANERIKLPSKLNSEGKYEPDWQYMEDFIKQKEKDIESLKYIYTKNQNYSQIRKGLEFCLGNNERIKDILNKDVKDEKLNTSDWKEYSLNKIFKIKAPKTTRPESVKNRTGEYEFISRTTENNGVLFKCSEYTEDGNTITVLGPGGICFYHEANFLACNNMGSLHCDKMNKYSGLFICSILNKKSSNYRFGYERTNSRLAKEKIKLPSIIHEDGSYEPDWNYMESYIKKFIKSKKDIIIEYINNDIHLAEKGKLDVSKAIIEFISIGITEEELLEAIKLIDTSLKVRLPEKLYYCYKDEFDIELAKRKLNN